ncbi:hypothetical protein COY43_00880 [Candidatus Berkelbacteria bacterium CG_4_10_14_0_8_um_filter_35_9_33_8]|uniref:DUF5673 domain-containing protein n=1 Tax=Candidatus Berkelbacteria bacterium CG_4_10_14_0_2_um_filter_35_9_33_12 TaxID=1974499 RepID=A0A2M7W3Q7_9BACT|nr:MAG: hypothetical protein COX10_02880 [Candidatus Berkelbacteria bacterium CG23_combo_of_CG06-09_8_20_14_all_33_15]PIZ28366.1 MAG: hypothetical protein COY43_00880 [Candidatus Berkelbacteria bacterium CG_4_10_14_0_8_um_filter_35_9_33_8]PJA20194.1 MAG: hypothetical protein COX60_02445 [Candidatus Berkelbacteria bacterium CG_4_10_14_0_2_um_filter_35_9_33_12]PJB51699.1 MAG: hypothetical protein CO100_01825 [Candidatus Berkelbacteria bacterium CG_4_9_14_3_um_filter_33_5]
MAKETKNKSHFLEISPNILESYSSFKSPQFEYFEKTPWWFVLITFIFGTLVFLSFLSELYSLPFILILFSVVIYQIAWQRPKSFDFSLTLDGIKSKNKIYSWANFRHFWIAETKNHTYLYLQPKNIFSVPVTILVPIDFSIAELQARIRMSIPEKIQGGLSFSDRINQWLKI